MPESRVLSCDKTTWNGREAKKLSLSGSSCVHWLTTRCHPFYTLLQTPVCFVCNVCFCLILHSRLRVGFEAAFSCAVIFCTSKPTLVMNVVHAVWAGFQKKWRQPTVFLRLSIGLGLVRRTFHWILFLCLDTVLLVGLDHIFFYFFLLVRALKIRDLRKHFLFWTVRFFGMVKQRCLCLSFTFVSK